MPWDGLRGRRMVMDDYVSAQSTPKGDLQCIYRTINESGRKKIRNSRLFALWRKWRLKLGDGVWVCGCVCGG